MAESRPPVYSDATALIGLARIARLDLLTLFLTPIRVPSRVWVEATGNGNQPGALALWVARAEGLLIVVDEGDPNAFPELDGGECTVLTAASLVGAAVLIDELRARRYIRQHEELRGALAGVTGVIGLLLLAKQEGRVAAVKPLLDALRREDFWIGAALYQRTLREAGEP